jgi:hypothetical protein
MLQAAMSRPELVSGKLELPFSKDFPGMGVVEQLVEVDKLAAVAGRKLAAVVAVGHKLAVERRLAVEHIPAADYKPAAGQIPAVLDKPAVAVHN